MRNLVVLVLIAGLTMSGAVFAGDMTNGLTITGGENAFAQLTLERAANSPRDEGILKLQVSMAETKNLKGYGFVLNFDTAKYEFVEAKEVKGNLLSASSDQQTLFLSSSRTAGELSIGAMKVDGQAVTGEGKLVELTFKITGTPLSEDFQISEGVLVGFEGNIDVLANIEIADLKPLPDSFGLGQNMPNPFNPSTNITYQLPEAGQVRLVIYNLLGQEIRVLANERLEAGYYTVTWDGTDQMGRQVASGIYLYRMQAGKFVDANRMMLLK
jgi:hypothetical protein